MNTWNAALKAGAKLSTQELMDQFVVPTYRRFPIALQKGQGVDLWAESGKHYMDLGGGIAVNALGHAHPEIVEALRLQASSLMHVSNLYYQRPQAELAATIVGETGPGKVFFCNSGAEANEALFKLARRVGHDQGRFEIITATGSFHGRTLAGIAACGQEKVRQNFGPITPGFRHVPLNDFEALKAAWSASTIAVLIEGIQGEGGIHPAQAEYLKKVREWTKEQNALLLMDSVQCGFYRTGRFQSYQRLMEGVAGGEDFLPDAIGMAKSLGAGFPMGAVWIRDAYADVLGAGSHGTTFGGTPLACAVALKTMEIVKRDHLDDNARNLGEWMKERLNGLVEKYSATLKEVRGVGLMLGVQLQEGLSAFSGAGDVPSLKATEALAEAGLILIPSGTHTLRFLPPLNLTQDEAERALTIFESVIKTIS